MGRGAQPNQAAGDPFVPVMGSGRGKSRHRSYQETQDRQRELTEAVIKLDGIKAAVEDLEATLNAIGDQLSQAKSLDERIDAFERLEETQAAMRCLLDENQTVCARIDALCDDD